MPIPANTLSLLRTRPSAQNWHLCVHRPPTIWTAQVNGSPARGATSIPFDNEVETEAPVKHMMLWVGTTVGARDVGVLRFKAEDGTNLTVNSNDVEWVDDYFLTVKKNFQPLSVLPSISGVMEDETKAYTDENSLMHPLARIGPPACGHLSEGDELPIDFWSDDVAMTGSLSSYAWTFENGTPSSSVIAGTETVPIEVMYSTASGHEGHWVTHTVTDSNAKTHTRYSQVFIFDENTPAITAFDVSGLSGDRNSGGWRASIVVREDADIEHFPEYAQVVIFNKQYWGTTQQDIGYDWTGRENILFVGYIVRDTVVKEPETGYVTFEVASIVEIMKELTAWGASFKSTTGGWHDIPNMTLNKEAFHVFTEHSTIDHIADIYLNLDDIDMKYTDITEGKLYEQIKIGIGEAGRALLLNNKVGQIYLEPDVQLKLVADRTTIDEMFTMDHDDWRDTLTLGEELALKEACQVDFIGFYYDDDGNAKALGSLAPGRQFESGVVQKITGVRVDTQAEANNYAGVFGGELNNEFKNIVVPMSGFWPVMDIAPQRFIQITLVAGDTLRELVWTAEDCVIQTVSFTIDNEYGYCLTDLTVQRENTPIGALTNEIPEVVVPEPPSPPAPIPPPELPEESDWGVILWCQHVVARCKDFFTTDEDQHWTDITPTDLDVDQDSPAASVDEIYQLSVNEDTGEAFLTTSIGMFHTSNINNMTVNWTHVLDMDRIEEDIGAGYSVELRGVKTHDGQVVTSCNGSPFYYRGTAASLDCIRLPWSTIMESDNPPNVQTKYGTIQKSNRVNTWNVDYVDSRFHIGCSRKHSATVWRALTLTNALDEDVGKFVLYDHDGSSIQIGAMTDTYVQTYAGYIYLRGFGKSPTSAHTVAATYSGAMPNYGMDELQSNLLYTDNSGKLYYNGVEKTDNETIFGVEDAEPFRAIFTRDNIQEILCVNSEEVYSGDSKAIVAWTGTLFTGSPTHYDKTGDYLTAVGDWLGGKANDGNAGAELYKMYKYT